MEINTHWIIDDFFHDAHLMREKIDRHFDDAQTRQEPFASRAIWNYWYIDKLYTYLRAQPTSLYQELHDTFMEYLKQFVAVNYGLSIMQAPFLSMYVNGCGQGVHNDAKNGRLAFVFSLTRWQEKHFDGGETVIYRFPDLDKELRSHSNAGAGTSFYDLVEASFNRLIIFDDRVLHAVRPIQGKMDPNDARFVVHGHISDPKGIEYIEGGLEQTDLTAQWEDMNKNAVEIFKAHNHHGFVTIETEINTDGSIGETHLRHAQLLPLTSSAKPIADSLDAIKDMLAKTSWPVANSASRLVFALCSAAD